MAAPSFADSYNRDVLEREYEKYHADPDAADPQWQAFFAGVEFAGGLGGASGNGSANGHPKAAPRPAAGLRADTRLQTGAVRLIFWYRQAGHLQAHTNPLADGPPAELPLLKLENFHLTEADLDTEVDSSMVFGEADRMPLRRLIDILKATYCGNVGVEFMHIDDLAKRTWLASRMEPTRNRRAFSLAQKYRTLMTLHYATKFEQYLHTKYVGQKRFSLEGGETLMPMLDAVVEKSPELGVQEIVIGMAHRGRLNVLANTLQKPFAAIFNEFEDVYMPETTKDGDGDVKYHLGFGADIPTSSGKSVHISLTPNPSHLEAVDPVVEGRVRAKQRQHGDTEERGTGLPLLIHGDAAFAGQGLVAETLNMSNLAGYRTGGTLHIVVNNQIGFTTGPRDARSTQYCTDIAKFVSAPVFHVHGDDPESAVYVAQLALEYRQAFKSDVVIDLVCYRKYGHNEGDEPAFTQPVEYCKIQAKKSPADVYTAALVANGDIAPDEADALDEAFRQRLDEALKGVRDDIKAGNPRSKRMGGFTRRWKDFTKDYSHAPADTALTPEQARTIADMFLAAPEGFHWHPTIKKLAEKRRASVLDAAVGIDWATGEALAFGSLVLDGFLVRLSGQDCRRGTFSHRHSSYFDQETGKPTTPLAGLRPGEGLLEIYDSSLSEAAVLGFEYGFTLDEPNALVMWEAQFGDFANGAQVITDQFIASGESKWNRSSGLVMLLPHGYEGQGPEHSSARLERFLQLCAEDNIQVCNFTTPANYFHALRRQVKRNFRKPLVVMTPKSLLRLPAAVSKPEEFTDGRFHEVIGDATADPTAVTRVVLCSGKVYYELAAKRDKEGAKHVAVVRLEQFYPWPEEQLKAELSKYAKATEFVWCQEEPHNNGGWFFVEPRLRTIAVKPFEYVGRDPGASPSTGSLFVHKFEQAELVDAAILKPVPHYVLARKKPSELPPEAKVLQPITAAAG
jgi:2-oxoglutarate dehydrogenase E1 component